MKAKKFFGQHFLSDAYVIDQIIDHIKQRCSTDMPLLELGPGRGAISFRLAEHYPQFCALEIDRDMLDILYSKLPEESVMLADFMKTDLSELFDGKAFNLVGNFPYNISSQIVFRMIEQAERIPTMVGMFQKEMAERICASPGSKANGVITILAQAYYNTELLFKIGPNSFSPPPKVDSAVICLTRKESEGPDCDPGLLRAVVKQAFQQRRKKMRNTLKSFKLDLEDPVFQKRPEQLGVDEFVNIVNSIKKDN